MDWTDAHTPPTDRKTKLCDCYSVFQDRSFYALAYFDGDKWNTRNCKVVRYMDLEELIKDGEAIQRLLKAEADLSIDGLDYIERARAVRIVRGLE